MKWLVSIVVLFVATATYGQRRPVRQSQQFTVIDERSPAARSPGALKSATGEPLVRLDADVLLLSAERIREMLLAEMGLPRGQGGRIRLVLYMAMTPHDMIGLISALTPAGWEYEVDIPDQVDRAKLERGVVGVLLLELANRGQGPKSAEIPLWLVEGLSTYISAMAGPDLVVGQVPMGLMRRVSRERQGLDYLAQARKVLQAGPRLTFSEMAHPQPETLVADKMKAFQASSQLFVYEILHLNNGQAKLLRMLRDLPECWNWETAFLSAYSSDFPRMLDVEKRWAVDVLAFISTDPSAVWSKALALERLDDVLSIPAQVRLDANKLPERKILSLQELITNWAFQAQVPPLEERMTRLGVMRYTVPMDLVPLVDAYRRTLAEYVQRRSLAGRASQMRMQAPDSINLVIQDALNDLEQLDKRRKEMQPEQALTGNTPISR